MRLLYSRTNSGPAGKRKGADKDDEKGEDGAPQKQSIEEAERHRAFLHHSQAPMPATMSWGVHRIHAGLKVILPRILTVRCRGGGRG